jgi:hypothetical protein
VSWLRFVISRAIAQPNVAGGQHEPISRAGHANGLSASGNIETGLPASSSVALYPAKRARPARPAFALQS